MRSRLLRLLYCPARFVDWTADNVAGDDDDDDYSVTGDSVPLSAVICDPFRAKKCSRIALLIARARLCDINAKIVVAHATGSRYRRSRRRQSVTSDARSSGRINRAVKSASQ